MSGSSQGGRMLQRVMWMSAIGTVVTGFIGFIVVMVLNAFVLDEFDAYGEVPIPGSAEIVLPEGEVEISFHTSVTGSPSSGFPLPPLKLSIDPPPTVADPVLVEKHSGTTTINSDVHVRIWIAHVDATGPYKITTDGNVGGYINPRLAFGHESDYDWLHWFFAGMVGFGLLEVAATIFVSKQMRRGEVAAWAAKSTASTASESSSYQPSDQGIKNEQLKIIAALRETGALSAEEFEVEKRRILES